MNKVVGLCGKAGSGKSVVADVLEETGYTRVRFSAPLKNMLRAFLATCGLDEDEVERRIEGDLKETPDVLLGGKTPRYAMQTLGLEWGRVLISPTIWSNAWRSKAEGEIALGRSVVAEDVRFETEVSEIHRLDGRMVEIVGRGKSLHTQHASEDFVGVTPDFQIQNNSTVLALEGAVKYIFRAPADDEV